MSLKKVLMENREKLEKPISQSSAKTYMTTIGTVARSIEHEINSADDVLKYKSEIIKSFKELSPSVAQSRKTALVVLLSNGDPKYNDLVEELHSSMVKDKNKKDATKGEKTEKQTENWIPWPEVVKKYKVLEKKVTPLFKKDADLTDPEFKMVQTYVILSCLILIPPRRSLDFTAFKIRNSSDDWNYMSGNKFVFNKYKTAWRYGQQKIDIPVKLKNIINKWATINTSDWLIVGKSREKGIAQSQLTRILNDFFDSDVGTALFRYLYDTWKFENGASYAEMKKVAYEMGHSVEQAQTEYVKKAPKKKKAVKKNV